MSRHHTQRKPPQPTGRINAVERPRNAHGAHSKNRPAQNHKKGEGAFAFAREDDERSYRRRQSRGC